MKSFILAIALAVGVTLAGLPAGQAQDLPGSCMGPPAIDPIKVKPPSWTNGGLPGVAPGVSAICDPVMLVPSVSPAVPVAGQTVTVTFKVHGINLNASSTIKYDHVGTDGYQAGGILPIGPDGIAHLNIPGGKEGVIDTITANVTGTKLISQFAIKYGKKIEPVICFPIALVPTATPAAPAAGQKVVVKLSVTQPMSGAPVQYQITGSDGYKHKGNIVIGVDGTASFEVPGGAAGVVDTITAKIPCTEISCKLTLKFGSDLPPAGAEKSAIDQLELKEWIHLHGGWVMVQETVGGKVYCFRVNGTFGK